MTETCRPQLLTDYLQGTCQSEDEAWLFSHLEQCLHCRSQLDAEAADQKTWDSLPFLNLELQPEYCGESSAEFLKHVAAQATGRSSVHPVSPQDSGGEEGNSGADNLPADNLPVDGVRGTAGLELARRRRMTWRPSQSINWLLYNTCWLPPIIRIHWGDSINSRCRESSAVVAWEWY